MSGEQYIFTMDSDYCSECGVYLFDGGINDDNSGMCSFCFDQWLDEQNEDEYDDDDYYDPADYEEIGTLEYGPFEQERGLPPMPAPRKRQP